MIHYPFSIVRAWFPPLFGTFNPPATRGTATTGSLTASGTVTLPTFSAGDQLVVGIWWETSGTGPSAPAGWTAKTPVVSGSGTFSLFTKTAVGGDTFVSGASVTIGVYNAYAIKNAPVGFDNSVSTTGTTGSPISTGTVTLTGNNDTWLNFYCSFGNAGNPVIGTPSAGAPTAQVNNSNYGIVSAWQSLLSQAGPSNTATVTNSLNWVGFGAGIH